MGKGEEHLVEAVKAQDVALVQKLLNKGKGKLLGSSRKVNLNYQDGEGFSALHYAAMSGQTELVCALIDAGATVDLGDRKGMRPLHYAAWKGKFQAVAALLQSGSSCSRPSVKGCTPLHLSAQYGHLSVCKILVQYGASVLSRNSDGETPLDLACEFGRSEVVGLFLHNSDPSIIDQLLAQKSDGDYSMTSSPLHLAAKNGHTAVVKSLLQAGIDINWRTTSGTCLHEAVANERVEIVQLLIDCGIDTGQRSGLGQTPLELAKKLSKSPPIMEIIRKLTEANPRFVQVYATNDFNNILDQTSLAFTKGTVITVLEQNSNGIWKGRIENNGRSPCVGTFPASFVQPYHQAGHTSNMAGSDDSGIHPHEEEGPASSNPPPHYQPTQWGRGPAMPPAKPNQMPHKYINVDPRNHGNPPQVTKVTLVNANVNNPSYDDVICTQQVQANGAYDRPITASRSGQEAPLVSPHITNPGYEDVLLDQTSCGGTNTASSHTSSASWRTHLSSGSSRPHSHVTNAGDDRGGGSSTDSTGSKQSVCSNSDEQVYRWLSSFGMEQYVSNFLQHGYDIPTIARTNAADLTAIRISKPPHRKKLANQVSLLRKDSPPSPQIDELPRNVSDWLVRVGLPEYISTFNSYNVNSIEKLIETTWEDLQEMRIEKLGHQKKLVLAITKLGRAYKQIHEQRHQPDGCLATPPHWSVNQHPNPQQLSINAEQLQVNRLKKPPEPPNKTFSSFKESPGLSLELQKALSRRQRIIEGEANRSNPPVPSDPGSAKSIAEKRDSPDLISQNNPQLRNLPAKPSSEKVNQSHPGSSATKQHFQRTNSCRGPPPNPPKRTTSVCMDDDPIVDDGGSGMSVRSIAAMMGNTQNGERSRIETRPSSAAVTSASSSGSFVAASQLVKPSSRSNPPVLPRKPSHLIPSDAAPKPVVAAKPKPALKPALMKKPRLSASTNQVTPPRSNNQVTLPGSSTIGEPVARATMSHDTSSTSGIRKTSHEEPGKHFDLSALDAVEQQSQAGGEKVKKKQKNFPANPSSKSNVTPIQHPMTPSLVDSLNDLPDSSSFVVEEDSFDEFEFPAPPPSMLDPPQSVNNDVATSYCLESIDLPLPPLPHPPVEHRICFEADEDTGTVKRRPPSISNRDEDETQLPPNIKQPISSSTGPSSFGLDRESRSLDAPPPIPKKTAQKDQLTVGNSRATTADLSDTTSEDKTRQMLDDIGSMFDDLVQEFDDILN